VIVIDASVILEVLIQSPAADRIEERIFSQRETLHAPHLIDLEVVQVLRRYSRSGEVSSDRALEAIRDFSDLHIAKYPHAVFLSRIWELRDNFTAYDAAYIALAEALGAPLLTRDVALAAAPGHTARVELV
jgi:predicted nucleic acid-binding protein